MSVEQLENNLNAETFFTELMKMTPDQLEAWIKDFRDNQLLIKVSNMIQSRIENLPQGTERMELGSLKQRIADRIRRNRKIIIQGNSLVTGTLGKKKKDFNI